MNRLARAVISSRSRALSVGSTLAAPVRERSRSVPASFTAGGRKTAVATSVTILQLVAPPGLPRASAAAAEKLVEKRGRSRAKWPCLQVLEHFDQPFVQRRQVIDLQRLGSSRGAAVEDRADAAPRRFPQSARAVPLSALRRASYSAVTAAAFKRRRGDSLRDCARHPARSCGRARRWRYIRPDAHGDAATNPPLRVPSARRAASSSPSPAGRCRCSTPG